MREHPDALLLAPSVVASRIGVHRQTVYRWMRSGALPYVQIGGTKRIRRSDLDSLVGKMASSAVE